MTLLHHVCNCRSAHQTSWVSALFELGASATATDADGNAPLTFTAMSGNASSAAALLAKGAGVNHLNALGESPLLVAAACGECAVIDVLIAHGADLTTKATSGEHAGRNALVAARACMRMPAAKLIERCAEARRRATLLPRNARARLCPARHFCSRAGLALHSFPKLSLPPATCWHSTSAASTRALAATTQRRRHGVRRRRSVALRRRRRGGRQTRRRRPTRTRRACSVTAAAMALNPGLSSSGVDAAAASSAA